MSCFLDGWLTSDLTPPSFSLNLCSDFLPDFTLLNHWPKQLYSLANKSNTYTEGHHTSAMHAHVNTHHTHECTLESQIPQTCWLACIAKLMNCRLCDIPCLKGVRQRVGDKDIFLPFHVHAHGCTHTHTHTQTHTHTLH